MKNQRNFHANSSNRITKCTTDALQISFFFFFVLFIMIGFVEGILHTCCMKIYYKRNCFGLLKIPFLLITFLWGSFYVCVVVRGRWYLKFHRIENIKISLCHHLARNILNWIHYWKWLNQMKHIYVRPNRISFSFRLANFSKICLFFSCIYFEYQKWTITSHIKSILNCQY